MNLIWSIGVYALLGMGGLGLGWLINRLADNLPPAAERGRPGEPTGAARSVRPVVVEIVAALGLPALWIWAGGNWLAAAAAALVVLFVGLVVVIDIEYHLILWRVIWVAAIGAALLGTYQHGWPATLWGGLAGFVFLLAAFGLGLLLEWLLRNENAGLGGGDVNLAGVLGLLLGWPLIGPALLTAIFAGGLFGCGYLLVQRARRRPAPPFAYGPFLALSGLAVYLWPDFFRLF